MAEVLCPMPGKIWKININVGDQIEVDQEVVVLESMKMEVGVFAEDAGTIKEILVKEGDSVDEGMALAIVE